MEFNNYQWYLSDEAKKIRAYIPNVSRSTKEIIVVFGLVFMLLFIASMFL